MKTGMKVATSTPVETLGAALCFTGILAAAFYWSQGRIVDVAVLMLVGLGQVMTLLAFRTGAPRALVGAVLLIAGVSAAELLYERFLPLDLIVHFLLTYGLVRVWWNYCVLRDRAVFGWAATTAGALNRRRARQRVVACTLVGLILALVWEAMELLGYLFVSPDIHVPPLDTVTDVLAGCAGAALVALHRRPA